MCHCSGEFQYRQGSGESPRGGGLGGTGVPYFFLKGSSKCVGPEWMEFSPCWFCEKRKKSEFLYKYPDFKKNKCWQLVQSVLSHGAGPESRAAG